MTRVSSTFDFTGSSPYSISLTLIIDTDLRVFVDPRALRLLQTDWGHECVALIQDFFSAVMAAIRDGNDGLAKRLLQNLKEPNETHLGLSTAESRGRALVTNLLEMYGEALSQSEAARSGLLEDLEDTVLLVDGILQISFPTSQPTSSASL